MALPKYSGRPVSCAITSPSATISDIKSCSFSNGAQIIMDRAGNSRQAQCILGDDEVTIEVTTSDLQHVETLKQGVICGTVVLTFNGAKHSDGTAHTANNVVVTLSDAVQENAVQPQVVTAGEPAQVTYRFKLCKGTDGADGTITATIFSS